MASYSRAWVRVGCIGSAGKAAANPTSSAEPNLKYTFEMFVCVAIFAMYRRDLLRTRDVGDIFVLINKCVSRLPFLPSLPYATSSSSCPGLNRTLYAHAPGRRLVERMDLDAVLVMAERAFFEYCRKSVTSHEASYMLLF